MLHCLRNDSYRKPSAKPELSEEEQGLHPLVVEPAVADTNFSQILVQLKLNPEGKTEKYRRSLAFV